jgi:hypothetical protein
MTAFLLAAIIAAVAAGCLAGRGLDARSREG